MKIFFKVRNKIVSYIMRNPNLWFKVVHIFRTTFLISVIGVIKDEDDRILMLKHTYRPSPWHLPSGWLKKGETPLATIAREVKEETGFIIESKKILFIGSSPERNHLEYFVEGKFKSGKFKPSSEIIDYKWVEEKPDEPLLEGYYSVLNKVLIKEESCCIGYYEVNWK